MFVAMAMNAGCLLPFHFAPGLLEAITYKKMNIFELNFFMEKMDPDLYNTVNKSNPIEFKELDTGFENVEEYYRDRINGQITSKKMKIYNSISKHFELFDAFHNFNIALVDSTFSGLYTMTAEHVFSCTEFTSPRYQDMWKQFVCSLSETEIKQMLITFGSTLALNNKYAVNVVHDLEMDIRITTCFRKIDINKKLFTNMEYLNNLKLYFTDSDQISDRIIIMEEVD